MTYADIQQHIVLYCLFEEEEKRLAFRSESISSRFYHFCALFGPHARSLACSLCFFVEKMTSTAVHNNCKIRSYSIRLASDQIIVRLMMSECSSNILRV